MSNYLYSLIYSIIFLLLLLIIELISRKHNLNRELTRKTAHILSGLFGAAMGLILSSFAFITLTLMFLLIISLSYFYKFFSSIHDVKRKTYGEIFLPLGILITYLLAPGSPKNFLASILILAISDPLAGLTGDFSKNNILYRSITFFVATITILLLVFQSEQIIFLIIVAFILTFIENISSYGTDNITIPITSILLLKLQF